MWWARCRRVSLSQDVPQPVRWRPSRRRRVGFMRCNSTWKWSTLRAARSIWQIFVFRVCGCRPDWDPRNRVPALEREIRECVGGRSVFFFVSGGVDSSVAFALCTRALGADRVRGVYVDTGLMREGETEL